MIELKDVSVGVGSFSLTGVSFTIPKGSYGILMGRTGCGKTTILEAVCGLRKVLTGRITLGKRDVTQLKPAERGIGYVPQDGALFSTMTVFEHLAFALNIRKWSRNDINKRVHALAELLGIAYLLPRRPLGLSGGEAQRVALGRALSPYPEILCLDEPLSALDHETREDMCALLKAVKTHTGVTTLHITHDINEARRLADNIFRIIDGAIQEVETG